MHYRTNVLCSTSNPSNPFMNHKLSDIVVSTLLYWQNLIMMSVSEDAGFRSFSRKCQTIFYIKFYKLLYHYVKI